MKEKVLFFISHFHKVALKHHKFSIKKNPEAIPSRSVKFFSTLSQALDCAPNVACKFSICLKSGRVAELTDWVSS